MTSWEFLIQKYDDIKWYPANSSNLELEPGKYRILAKSNRYNSLVDVHLSTPDQEQLYHQRRINSQGLVMIVPFTELNPGTSLRVSCYGDIFSELLGEGWRESINLNILPIAEQNSLPNSPGTSQAQITKYNKAQEYLDQLEKLLQEKTEIELNNKQQQQESQINEHPLKTTPSPEISLEEDNFIINAGERINLSGRIDIGDIQGEIAVNAKLRYELIDPESDETLLRVDYPLSEEKLPYRFNHTLVIPDDIDHDFLVGELILETQRRYHLTHASFTITTHHYYPVNCTIELMDTQTKDSYTFDLELAEKINSKHSHIELPNPLPYYRLLPLNFRKHRQVLPPKLENNCVTEEHKKLKLPNIR